MLKTFFTHDLNTSYKDVFDYQGEEILVHVLIVTVGVLFLAYKTFVEKNLENHNCLFSSTNICSDE